ncbi:uncharacterized protein LOC112468416 [Temnothorax curvispinosus]|uniref:Uncharacterized protein LOC112468416 n=1 Tax=Temnothorax curvispinosus TaxID=300111 RepID=A0A6J1RG89_9HYME|nr:uncharacterized protein LOC112468416 [Temnothorax curvispinosus]
MFTIIFSFGLITTQVTAKLPSYLHACSHKDTNYNQCIANSIDSVKDKVCAGFPEINIPPGEPLTIDKIVIFDANNIKLYLKDAKIYGLCDFVVNSVNADFEKLHFDIDLSLRHIYTNVTYDFDIHLLVPIGHKGPAEVTSDNLGLKVGLDLKVLTRNDKKYIFASKATAKCDIKSFKYKFIEDKKELADLHKILDDVVAKDTKEVIKAVSAAFEEKLSRFVISMFNDIAFSRYEELFSPEI